MVPTLEMMFLMDEKIKNSYKSAHKAGFYGRADLCRGVAITLMATHTIRPFSIFIFLVLFCPLAIFSIAWDYAFNCSKNAYALLFIVFWR